MFTSTHLTSISAASKNTPYKWLDLSKLCAILLPQHQIERIKYFTAYVKALPNNPDAPRRQQTYIRALQTLSHLEIVYGHFLSHNVRMPLAHPIVGQPRTVEVLKTEEKGSDVNLAVGAASRRLSKPLRERSRHQRGFRSVIRRPDR